MKPTTASRYIPWLLGLVVSAAAIAVWFGGLGASGLTAYSWFPLFGLLAWSLMWTHYIYGVLMVQFGFERNRPYQKISTKIVFACLWLHPGILAYQLWIDKQMLPPASLVDYFSNIGILLLIGAIVAWLTFLSFDILIRYKKRPFWQRNWFWVSVSQAFAMTAIYLHAVKLGRHIQVPWFKAYWLVLGVMLGISMAYLLWNELADESKLKQMIRGVMKNTKLLVIAGLIGIALIAAGAYAVVSREASESKVQETTASTQTTQAPAASGSTSSITLAKVEQNNGKDGAKCWVIVDDTVYEISGFAQWVDGLHTPSGGRARCGKDLSDVIGQAGHGRSVLKLLTVVGAYQQ